MRQLIIGTEQIFGNGLVASGDTDTLANLATGAITMARTSNNVCSTAAGAAAGHRVILATDLVDGERVYFIQRSGADYTVSNLINPRTFRWFSSTFAAAAARVIQFGYSASLPAQISGLPLNVDMADHVGRNAVLSIIDLNLPVEDSRRVRHYEHLIVPGDTRLIIMTSIVNRINADTRRVANAVNTTGASPLDAGVQLTAIAPGRNFAVRGSESFLLGTQSITTHHGSGTGISSMVAAIERDFATHLGFNPQTAIRDAMYTRGFDTLGLNYTVFVGTWTNTGDDILGGDNRKPEQIIMIAVPAGAVAGNIALQMAQVFASIVANGTTWGGSVV